MDYELASDGVDVAVAGGCVTADIHHVAAGAGCAQVNGGDCVSIGAKNIDRVGASTEVEIHRFNGVVADPLIDPVTAWHIKTPDPIRA